MTADAVAMTLSSRQRAPSQPVSRRRNLPSSVSIAAQSPAQPPPALIRGLAANRRHHWIPDLLRP